MSDKTITKVLIVDDEPLNLEIISNILTRYYKVVTAQDGVEALELALKEAPDLILLDILMPNMNGIDCCKEIKANDQIADIPVIFITTLGDKGNENIGLAAGGCDYISKPVAPAIVLARVNIHLQYTRYTKFLESLLSEKLTGQEDIMAEARRLKGRM